MTTSVSRYLSALPGLNLGLTNGVSEHHSNGVHPEPSRLVQFTQAQIERYVSSSLPPLDQRARAICFADHPALSTRLLRNAVGDYHTSYNYLGVEATLKHTAIALAHYALQVGAEKFLEEYRATKESDRPADRVLGDKESFQWSNRHYALWVQEYARSNGWNVFFEGVEKIPRGQPIVYAVFPHSSIFPDFALPYVDENAAYVADIRNFRNNKDSRVSGFSLLGDKKRQPLVYRGKPGETEEQVKSINTILFEQILTASAELDLHPAWFPHGMRLPKAWDDQGYPARAGFYSSNPKKGDPRVYIQTGFALNAVQLAMKLKKTVKLVIVTIQGAEFAMPKESKKAPFFQKNKAGTTITYRIVDTLDVPAATSPREARLIQAEVSRKAPEIAEEALGIKKFLSNLVASWDEKNGYQNTREVFEDKISNPKSGKDYLIAADKIRSIHPQFLEYGDARRQLVDFIRWQGEFPKDAMTELLTFVTDSVEKYQDAVIG